MTTPPEADRWFVECEQVLLRRVVAAAPDLSGPSLLPGWGRIDVAAHLIGNARGLRNLVTWAATGVRTPMYASREERAAQIAELAQQSPERLREQIADTSAALVSAYSALTPEQRAATITTMQGDDKPGGWVAWMRTRETSVHLVDLDIGFGFADLPPHLLDTIGAERLASLVNAADAPALILRPTDRDDSWYVGAATAATPADAAVPVIADASAAELVAWLIGRTPADRVRPDWPTLPPWL